MNDEEQMARLQQLMNERAEQQEQRQQNFDEINFAGGQRPGEEVVIIDMNFQQPLPEYEERPSSDLNDDERPSARNTGGRNHQIEGNFQSSTNGTTNQLQSPELHNDNIIHGFIDNNNEGD